VPPAEAALLAIVLVAQAYLFARSIHSATNYDEGVYLAAVDALRHGQALGTQVFAAQFPGFYDLLRFLSYLTGVGLVSLRAGLLSVGLLGTVGGWLVGRRFGGPAGGILVAAFLTVAPPLDLFGYQVIADTPALALMVLALGLASLTAPLAAVGAGVVLAAAVSVKLTAITVLPALLWLIRRRLIAGALGFAVTTAALLVAHAGALGALWASGVTYHEKARHTPEVIPHPHRQIFDQIPHTTPFFALACVSVAVAILAFVLRRPLRVWPLWSWVVLAVAFLLVHGPLHYNHLVLFPYALAVAAGGTLGALLDRLPRTAFRIGAAVIVLIVGAGWIQQLHRVDASRSTEPASNVAAASALRRLTPSDALTVDDRPIISFLAHRRVVGQLVDLAALRFETGSLTDRKVISLMGPADAVIVSRALRDHPVVLAFVRRHFRLRYDHGGVSIWIRRP
jgi:hypothetical protein